MINKEVAECVLDQPTHVLKIVGRIEQVRDGGKLLP